MKNTFKIKLVLIICLGMTYSCGNLTEEVEEKLDKLNDKTEQLDSIVDKELKKVNTLDSLINKEGEKVKKLDSLINKSSTKIDSIAKSKMNLLKRNAN